MNSNCFKETFFYYFNMRAQKIWRVTNFLKEIKKSCIECQKIIITQSCRIQKWEKRKITAERVFLGCLSATTSHFHHGQRPISELAWREKIVRDWLLITADKLIDGFAPKQNKQNKKKEMKEQKTKWKSETRKGLIQKLKKNERKPPRHTAGTSQNDLMAP